MNERDLDPSALGFKKPSWATGLSEEVMFYYHDLRARRSYCRMWSYSRLLPKQGQNACDLASSKTPVHVQTASTNMIAIVQSNRSPEASSSD